VTQRYRQPWHAKALVFAFAFVIAPSLALSQTSQLPDQNVGPVAVKLRVIDAATREPVAGAVITVVRTASQAEISASDESGLALLSLLPGDYNLEVSAAWLATTSLSLTVVAGNPISMDIMVDDDESKVQGEVIEIRALAPTETGQSKVSATLAKIVPGGGDALKVVQGLPSVSRPPAGSADLIVWGAAPRDTRVFLDGVPVPSLYHFGGYRSALGNAFIESVTLSPAGFAAQRGGAIGGVIDVEQKSAKKAPRLLITADILDVGASAGGRLGRSTVAVAGRSSVLGPLISAIADTEKLGANLPLPSWSDAQLLVSGNIGRSQLQWWAIASRDALARVLPSTDPSTKVTDDVQREFVRSALSMQTRQPNYQHELMVWFGLDRLHSSLLVGETLAARTERTISAGARASERMSLTSRLDLTLGGDVESAWSSLSRQGSLSIPAREGDPRIFGQPPGDDYNQDRWSAGTVNAAAFATLFAATQRWTSEASMRAEAWILTASRSTPNIATTPAVAYQDVNLSLSPRLSIKALLGTVAGNQVQARVQLGRYLQARNPDDTSAVFGTPSLGTEKAWHATAGVQTQWRMLRWELSVYGRLLDQLVVRDETPTPRLAQVLTQQGSGKVIGAQLTARLIQWHNVEGWVSYGLSRSTRRDSSSGRLRPFDHDQTHNASLVLGWTGDKWSAGTRLRMASGEPRTSVVGAFFDARSGRFQPRRGLQNDVRLPWFFACDLRVERKISIKGADINGYLELQNVGNRRNAEEIVYSADLTTKSYLQGLPMLALLGLRYEVKQ
jgi:hypothetical protein